MMIARSTLASIAALGALAGCAVTTPPAGDPPVRGEPQGSCVAEPGQRFVGTRATAEVGAQLLAATGAKLLRWVPPRTAVTMDFNPSRLTVSYDDNSIITTVACT
jgi:hypothetical protein